jgi:thioredoxin-related protein
MVSLKHFAILIALLAACSQGLCQDNEKIHWLTLKEATDKNVIAPKKIFIDVYTGWCGWCKRMDATSFQDDAVINYINQKFYPVKLDAETRDTIFYKNKGYTYIPDYKSNEIAAYLLNGKMGYPTSVYLDEKMDLIAPVQGYLDKDQLLKVMKYFGDNLYLTIKWDDYVNENSK